MNIRDLEYLVAIDEEKHFNRAAERCFVSQPTLSGQLKKLEEELGVLVAERTNRQVIMTDVGQELANQARRILAEVRSLKEIAQSFHDPLCGELHVGLIPTLAPYLLPLIMPQLNQKFPKLKLWLYEYQTKHLLDKLRNSELDLLILALPVETDEFAEIDLFNEAFYLAVSSNNALSMQHNLNLMDLQDHEMLLLQEGHCLRGQALDVCYAAGAHEHSGFQATSLETLRHMVSEGMGMTLIPELAVPMHGANRLNVSYISFNDPQPTRRVGMLYRQGNYREQAYHQLAKVIKDHILTYR